MLCKIRGDLSLSIEVKAFKNSHSVIAPSDVRVWFYMHSSDRDSCSLKRVW